MSQLIGLSIVFTTLALPAWAATEIPAPASIGGVVLGIGAAWLILRSRRRK